MCAESSAPVWFSRSVLAYGSRGLPEVQELTLWARFCGGDNDSTNSKREWYGLIKSYSFAATMPDRAIYMRMGQTKSFQPVLIEWCLTYPKEPSVSLAIPTSKGRD